MKTNHHTFTITLEIHIELDNDNIHIRTRLPESKAPSVPPIPVAEGAFLFDGSDAVTIKEAVNLLGGVRGTVDNLRRQGKLTSYYRGRHVRLDRREIWEARKWWSVPKGKV